MQFFRDINNAVANIINTPAVATIISLLARILMAAIFVLSGLAKIKDTSGTAAYMEHMGVPGAMLPLVILVELGGGLALLFGFQTRFAALALAVFSVIAAFIFHTGADQMQQINFMKNLAMAGGLLAFTLHGAGRASLDCEQRKS